MKLKAIVFSIFVFCCVERSLAQLPDYHQRIRLLYSAINSRLKEKNTGLYFETTDSAKNENKHAWLWPLCALIQATNEMETLEPGRDEMLTVERSIAQYYSSQPPLPAYQDYVYKERVSSRFYDDNQWVAIAYLDAYQRKHRKKYLDVAVMIDKFMMTGYDTAAGGGLYWKEGDKTTKNTCSNGPAVLVALQLYRLTHQAQYLEDAMTIYSWTNQHLQAPDGLFYDNIRIPSLQVNEKKYTYNTGSMLQANALLFTITKEKKYLQEAQRIAKAGRTYFFRNDRLPNEYWFNAVMLRGYEELYNIDKNTAWIDFFKQDAERIWNTERDEKNMLGVHPAKRLIDQAAMIEIYARLARLVK